MPAKTSSPASKSKSAESAQQPAKSGAKKQPVKKTAKPAATKTALAPKKTAKVAAKRATAKPAPAPQKTAKAAAKRATAKPAKRGVPMTLAAAMAALEQAGSEQTRKTYTRHGATGPMFGVSFATQKTLKNKIKVDHELAFALWDTGNLDARILAVKVVDPARMTPADLDRWASEPVARMCKDYVACLASEGSHGRGRAEAWLASKDPALRSAGWSLVGALAMRDEGMPDSWFAKRLAEIEKTIHAAPNAQREAMNQAVIAIGCRSDALREAAIAAAKRIGVVDIDHGDTACKTPDAAPSIQKAWAYSTTKGFASPAAQERGREPMRTRC